MDFNTFKWIITAGAMSTDFNQDPENQARRYLLFMPNNVEYLIEAMRDQKSHRRLSHIGKKLKILAPLSETPPRYVTSKFI